MYRSSVRFAGSSVAMRNWQVYLGESAVPQCFTEVLEVCISRRMEAGERSEHQGKSGSRSGETGRTDLCLKKPVAQFSKHISRLKD